MECLSAAVEESGAAVAQWLAYSGTYTGTSIRYQPAFLILQPYDHEAIASPQDFTKFVRVQNHTSKVLLRRC